MNTLSFQRTFRLIEKAIGIAHRRHSVIAGNLSNLDTPGYRGKDINFKTALEQALTREQTPGMSTTHPKHINSSGRFPDKTEVTEEEGEWNGINYVNVDEAMVKLTENTLIYRSATEALMRKIVLMRDVIKESSR